MSTTAASASPLALEVASEQEGPRLLGLSVAERNRRLGVRARAKRDQAGRLNRGRLWVPAHAVLTPTLFDVLPPPTRTWHLMWGEGRRPLVWQDPDAASSEPPSRFDLPAGVVQDISTPTARREVAWQLLIASGKPGDGWLSRHLHRKVSRRFSYVFLHVGVTANVATLATFGLGLVAAWLIAQTSHATLVAGALLYWATSIADGIDGEIARLTLTESAAGEAIDTAVDQATHGAALLGVLVGWWRQGMGPADWVLAVVVLVGTPVALMTAMSLVRRARGSTQRFVAAKPIEGAVFAAAQETGAVPLRMAAAMFVLFRREAFSVVFFLVSLLTSMRAVYPALIAGALVVVGVTLTAYRSAIASALQVSVGSQP